MLCINNELILEISGIAESVLVHVLRPAGVQISKNAFL